MNNFITKTLFLIFLKTCFLSPIFSQNTSNYNVKTGMEVLREYNFGILRNKRVGLITNPTGIDRNMQSTIDILHNAPEVNLVALFAPEHGIRGDVYAGERVATNIDPKTRIKVYSLYGKTKKPTTEMLQGIDVLVYDIQDIGCRSYTFISTMALAMEAAAENNIEFVVLDRPNPLGGMRVEGNLIEPGYYSFVSQINIPYIYGLTSGELARMLVGEKMLKSQCKLQIVKMEGWQRNMSWDKTGLPWVAASPHIPYASTALYYPTTGIIGELGFLNIGVGYTMPFQLIGAPWINADSLAANLNNCNIAGVNFRPIHYKPYYSNFKGEKCGGVQIYISDPNNAPLTEIQFRIIEVLAIMYPDKVLFNSTNQSRWSMFDKVCGSDQIRLRFAKRHKWEDVREFFEKDVDEFRAKSQKYWLY